MFNLPAAVLWIIVLLVAIEVFSQLVPAETYLNILQHFAFVPGRFTFAFDPGRVTAAFNAIPEDAEFRAQAATFFLGRWQTALVDAAHLCVFARQLAACGDELPVVRGVRLARRPPLWHPALFVVLRDSGNCRSGHALRDAYRGFAASRRRVGHGFRRHGRGSALRFPARRAAWRSARLFGARA